MQYTLIEAPFNVEIEVLKAERDEERELYRKKLAEKLKDPKFRSIEGFPNGTDKSIVELSDPPYYTACPNPFLEEWIKKHSTPFDFNTDSYHCEPFASDVSEGRNDPIYNAHSYHTKVPHKAIMRYLLHYTQPGDVVFDGFCGTGMTGVAAQLCGDKSQVESLGYRVVNDEIFDSSGNKISRLGARSAVLNDLSPSATFISSNYNYPIQAKQFEYDAKTLLSSIESDCSWMFTTLYAATPSETEVLASCINACKTVNEVRELIENLRQNKWEGRDKDSRLVLGQINYTVWSDVFLCINCGGEIVFWDAAIDVDAGKVREHFNCPHCSKSNTKRGMKPSFVSHYDNNLRSTIQQIKQVPVVLNIVAVGKRYPKKPDAFDKALIEKIESLSIPHWFPTERMPIGTESRRNDPQGITHTHHFFTHRNLWVLSTAWAYAHKPELRFLVTGIMQRSSKQHQLAITRIGGEKKGVGGATAGHRRGTLYIPSNQVEFNPLGLLQERVLINKRAATTREKLPVTSIIATVSSTDTRLPDNSIDYINTDPPFGGNLMYSELNFGWEAWLGVTTNSLPEAITNPTQKKNLSEYQQLMTDSFKEFYRILKPGRWMSVEFHNSASSVWNSIQEALETAGFVVADTRILDKQLQTHLQRTAASGVDKDLVITCYKPRTEWESRFSQHAGETQGIVEFLLGHLEMLPVSPMNSRGQLERVAERTRFLLFDRMVAYHLQRGVPIPISAAEFYSLLEEEFVERDGMYFLPTQAARYDIRRVSTDVEPLSLFVKDERTAVQWIRAQLSEAPQTLGELTPIFMKELATIDSFEESFELRDLLRDNFIEDDGIWRVPNPEKERDIEAVRRKGLLRTFQSYAEGNGKLKNFRKEAIIEGFSYCWKTHQYTTIVYVAERIPEKILREIHEFTQFYDIAKPRALQMPAQLSFSWD